MLSQTCGLTLYFAIRPKVYMFCSARWTKFFKKYRESAERLRGQRLHFADLDLDVLLPDIF